MTAAGRAVALSARVSGRARHEDRTPDFRALLGEAAWAQLPAAVQARFDAASHAAPRDFPGAMDVRMNWLGWLFAQGGRLFGAPLAPWPGEAVPVSVLVQPRSEAAACVGSASTPIGAARRSRSSR